MLKKLFPFLATLLLEKGITSSEAQRISASNRNLNERELKDLTSSLYETKNVIYSNSGMTSPAKVELTNKVSPEAFMEIIPTIATRNSKNAIYNLSIKEKEKARRALSSMTIADIATALELEIPVFGKLTPRQRTPIIGLSDDKFYALDKSEELLGAVDSLVLERFGANNCFAMLEVEAHAAAFGKQVHEGSFLRNLLNAEVSRKPVVTSNASIIMETTEVLAYDKEDFNIVEGNLIEKYDYFQKERNSYFKRFKDLVRKISQEYREAFTKEYAEVSNEMKEHERKVQIFTTKVEEMRGQMLQEIADLRIQE